MKRNLFRLLLSAVLMMCCMSAWADGDWTILEQPTCSKYGTMQNPANTSELRLVPKLAHHFGDDGKCTVCGHDAPTKYSGTPATSLVTITEDNYKTYGLTAKNKSCVMGWTVITTAEEFMKYINANGRMYININAFLTENIILDYTKSLPDAYISPGYVFDGTGHTISNVQRNGEDIVGLFGKNNGIIRNLGLISPKIEISGYFGGCICGNNCGTIENCFVIDGNIDGPRSQNYGIAHQTDDIINQTYAKIINSYVISNKGNVGDGTVTNSYGSTTGSMPDDFYSKTLSGLNNNKSNGMSWYHSSASYPVMMPSMIHCSAQSATCTEGGLDACWQCTVCGKYFSDATHSQETSPIVPALGHNMEHFAEIPATCTEKGIKEHYHCGQCEKDFDDENGTNEINDLGIPINSNNHNLSLKDGKAHCEWCNQDISGFVATNDKPVSLTKENDEYFLKADVVLDGGVNYLADVDFIVNGTFTYRRNVSGVQKGAWQCWYEPFEVQLDDDVLAKMDVAEVAGVLIDNEGNTVLAFRKIDSGWMKANTPYVFRPKDAILTTESMELKMTGPELYKSVETTFYNMSTYDKFTFGGNYTARHNDSWYTLNTSGQFQRMKEGVNLKGQRFWMTIEARNDIPYEYGGIADVKESIDFTVLGDDEPTGITSYENDNENDNDNGVIYNLNGQRVTSIQSGQVYIMNGKKYLAR